MALTGCDSFVCETYRIAAWPSLLYFLIFRPPHLEFALIYLSIPSVETVTALSYQLVFRLLCGFFIPKAFGISLELTGSPAGAMKVFLIFYIVCVFVTWLVYGRNSNKK